MIEIDSSIIDADILDERIKMTAKMKDIAPEFYSAAEMENEGNFNFMHQAMLSIYRNLQMMKATQIIEEKPIRSNRPVIGKWIVFCKRVFRKLTRWLFQPYYQQQTCYNEAATRTIADMIKVQENLIQAVEANIKGRDTDVD